MLTEFGKPNLIGLGTNADIDTSEEDIVVITDLTYLVKSQLTILYDYALGTNTTIKLRYYIQGKVGGNWYQLPVKVEATSILTDLPSTISSASPADRVVDNIPLPGCFGFKITGQGAGGANSSVTATVLARNN